MPSRRTLGLAVAALAVITLALALRLPELDLKPLHHDEGVNGWFTLKLFWWNHYHYNAGDYHGPFLYYVNLFFFHLLGPGEIALRIGTVLAGSATIVALLPARRFLGGPGVVIAGLWLAVSPGQVYFARTNIHETYLVLFTTLWAVGLARFAAHPERRWALFAGAAAALCFANKETSLITAGSLACGAGSAFLLGCPEPRSRLPKDSPSYRADLFGEALRWDALRSWFRPARSHWAAGFLLFALLILLFFSSFFTFWPGLGRFFAAFAAWFEHGTSGRNQGKDFGYYWEVMGDTAGLARVLAPVAIAAALASRDRVGLALGGWLLSAFVVYGLVPYKTPWCVLGLDLVSFLLLGWMADRALLHALDSARPPVLRALATLVPLLLLLPLVTPAGGLLAAVQSDNLQRYDDNEREYVYVQTLRGYFGLVEDVLGVAAADPGGDGRGLVNVNVDAKNPIRWYTLTRGWEHARSTYLSDPASVEQVQAAQLVISSTAHERAMKSVLKQAGGGWHRETYPLRPGVRSIAWYRQELWDAYQRAGGRPERDRPPPPVLPMVTPPR